MSKILISMPLYVPKNPKLLEVRRNWYHNWKIFEQFDNPNFDFVVFGMQVTDYERDIFDKFAKIIDVKPSPCQIGRALGDKYALDNGYSKILHVDDDFFNMSKDSLEDISTLENHDRAWLLGSSRLPFTARVNSLKVLNFMKRDNPGGPLYVEKGTVPWERGNNFTEFLNIKEGFMHVPGEYLEALTTCPSWFPIWNESLLEDVILLSYLSINTGVDVVKIRGMRHGAWTPDYAATKKIGFNYGLCGRGDDYLEVTPSADAKMNSKEKDLVAEILSIKENGILNYMI
jgi:hypothetical protein